MKIGVCAPARSLPADAAACLTEIAAEFPVADIAISPQCFLASGHFAGTDDQRADGLLALASDPSIDAIWFARGGYGSCRILPRVLSALGPEAQGKTFVGYSDTGFLLAALHAAGFPKIMHGPMVADGLRDGGESALRRVLLALSGSEVPNRAFAFNITVLAHLVGTQICPDFTGEEVWLEDIDEHLYALDRSFFTIFESGALQGAKGVRLGRISLVPENDIPFGEEPEAMIRRWCNAYRVPYLGRADIGHDSGNAVVAFPFTRAAR
ncbi:MAG: LD-carboxypeptidase [Parvularcula sp.]|jgi:muramoyltetrapeptide carboxypeptidase|nr:LD-carboxypeptidase [Parvularcula sp.]